MITCFTIKARLPEKYLIVVEFSAIWLNGRILQYSKIKKEGGVRWDIKL